MTPADPPVTIRGLEERDLTEADRIFRLAFGTHLRLPDPLTFAGDTDYVRTRWRTDPSAAFAAERGGELVGSNFALNWGSVGIFGPLSVRPDLWSQKIAQRLLEPTMETFARWGVTHAGLFTFAESPKHVGLYQRFGFAPRFLTALMSKTLAVAAPAEPAWSRYSQATDEQRRACIEDCRAVTDAIFEGLDVRREIAAVQAQDLGDTILVRRDDGRLAAFAICHLGAGTEAGSGTCYVKFAATRPGPGEADVYESLVTAVEEFAAAAGARRVALGVNTARHRAYRTLLARRYRTDVQGVAMHRPNDAAYDRADAYVIDDWR